MRESASTTRARLEIDARPDPHAAEPWFEQLPAEHREELTRKYRAGLHHELELGLAHHRRRWHESLAMGLVFCFADLFAFGSLLTMFVALVLGAALGLVCHRLDAKRLLTGAIGSSAFFAFECCTHGGVAGMHLLVVFPLSAVCALLGYKREDRGFS